MCFTPFATRKGRIHNPRPVYEERNENIPEVRMPCRSRHDGDCLTSSSPLRHK